MLKYYILMFVVVAIALLYAYIADPCNMLVRTEFTAKHPDYAIVDSDAEKGSRESVNCRVRYRKPGSEKVHEEVWLYDNFGEGWQFSRVLAKPDAKR